MCFKWHQDSPSGVPLNTQVGLILIVVPGHGDPRVPEKTVITSILLRPSYNIYFIITRTP